MPPANLLPALAASHAPNHRFFLSLSGLRLTKTKSLRSFLVVATGSVPRSPHGMRLVSGSLPLTMAGSTCGAANRSSNGCRCSSCTRSLHLRASYTVSVSSIERVWWPFTRARGQAERSPPAFSLGTQASRSSMLERLCITAFMSSWGGLSSRRLARVEQAMATLSWASTRSGMETLSFTSGRLRGMMSVQPL